MVRAAALLALIAARLVRQPPEQARRLLPVGREFPAVGGKIRGLARFRLQPVADIVGGQARRREAFHGRCIGLACDHHGAPTLLEPVLWQRSARQREPALGRPRPAWRPKAAALGGLLEIFRQVGAHARERRDREVRQGKLPPGEFFIDIDIRGRGLQDDLRRNLGIGSV